MVWLVDEAIRSRGLPGDVGHSDKLLLHTKTHTKTHSKERQFTLLVLTNKDMFFPWMERQFVTLESFRTP